MNHSVTLLQQQIFGKNRTRKRKSTQTNKSIKVLFLKDLTKKNWEKKLVVNVCCNIQKKFDREDSSPDSRSWDLQPRSTVISSCWPSAVETVSIERMPRANWKLNANWL